MAKCDDQDFPCQNVEYTAFDQVAGEELNHPISVSELVNGSSFCTELPVDDAFILGDMTHKLFLKGIRGKSGLYHLWVDGDHCDDHGNYAMLCVYVGKGLGQIRIDRHVRDKWPPSAQLYVTFTEMENRLSKYYEQLFLDTYAFQLNTNENSGSEHLFAVWDEDRHHVGTELHAVASLTRIRSFDDL